jgi:hypothetical protein
MKQGKAAGFTEDEHGTLWKGNRVCVPDGKELKQLILQEDHESPYSIHPDSTDVTMATTDTTIAHIMHAQEDINIKASK